MKEEYIILPISLLNIIMDMSIAEARTTVCLIKHYNNGSVFHLTREIRLIIAKETGLNERSIYNIIPFLEDKKVIVKIKDTKLHQINPRYAFKGSTMDRNKQLKMILELHCKDC